MIRRIISRRLGLLALALATLIARPGVAATSACLALSPAELQQSVGGLGFGAADPACPTGSVSDLVRCVFETTQCAAERTIFALDPRAADALGAAGIAAAHPCAAP